MALAVGALALGSGCQTQKTLTATTSGDLANSGVAAAEFGESTPITQEELQVLRENFLRVHFEFDRASLDGASRESLTANADILMRHPNVQVRIEGHADQYGSDIYNLALGQRRANSVRDYLANLGVSPWNRAAGSMTGRRGPSSDALTNRDQRSAPASRDR